MQEKDTVVIPPNYSSDIIVYIQQFGDTRNLGRTCRHLYLLYSQTQDFMFFKKYKLNLCNIYSFGHPSLLHFLGCGCIDCVELKHEDKLIWADSVYVSVYQQLFDGFITACAHNNTAMVGYLITLQYIWNSECLFRGLEICINLHNIETLWQIIREIIKNDSLPEKDCRNEIKVLSFSSIGLYNITYLLRIAPTHDDKIMYKTVKTKRRLLAVSFLIAELYCNHLFDIAEYFVAKYPLNSVGRYIIKYHIKKTKDAVLLERLNSL